MDIGGDASGARVLARYRHKLIADGARMLFVVNANRPFTQTADDAVRYLRDIEAASGLEMAGIINNSHLLDQTTVEDILAGAELAREISAKTNVPVVCHTVEEHLVKEIGSELEAVLPIKIYMKKPWDRR